MLNSIFFPKMRPKNSQFAADLQSVLLNNKILNV